MYKFPLEMSATIYLLPTVLHDDEEALQVIPAYVLDAVKSCQAFYAENEKTARRYFKKLWKEMVIDDYEWHTIHKAENEVSQEFIRDLKNNKTIGIISEAGCPGIADPGQILINIAQQHKAIVKPLVGPNSILLALMASGMSGQSFAFHGYLPIDSLERKNKIRELEDESKKNKCTQLFIETPYRNLPVFKEILQTCKASTRLCIAMELTGKNESVITKTIEAWKHDKEPLLHKIPATFLLYAD